MLTSATVMLPSSICSTPLKALKSVVLPEPLFPMIPRISPSSTEKLTFLRPTTELPSSNLYDLLTFSTLIMFMPHYNIQIFINETI